MRKPTSRKPRFRRTFPPPPIHLTARDFLILNEVSRHRFLRSDHLLSLIAGSRQHLIRRLGRLYHSGFLERPRHQRQLQDAVRHFCYCLSERGRKELSKRGQAVHPAVPRVRKLSTGLHLGHDLRVSDIVVALHSSAHAQGYRFRHHHEWPAIHLAKTDQHQLHSLKWKVRLQRHRDYKWNWVIPDAAFSFVDPDGREIHFLLEVDRGTMPVQRSNPGQTSFSRKIEAYRETRSSGHLWKQWQVSVFRVLVVTETDARRKSLQAATAKFFRRGTSTMFLFAVAPDLIDSTDSGCDPWQDCLGKPVGLLPKSPTHSR